MDLVVYEAHEVEGEIVSPELEQDAADTVNGFFAPMNGDFVDALLIEYARDRANIEHVGEIMRGEAARGAVAYFLSANDEDRRISLSAERLFEVAGALKALDSAYWQKVLSHTDIYEAMPQKRRDEWNEMIRQHKAPEFSEVVVRDTLGALLQDRVKFLAERVDGIWRGLSRDHKTNRSEGFYKRAIIQYAFCSRWGSLNMGVSGLVHDLRGIIAKFQGHEPSKLMSTYSIMEVLYRRHIGEWHEIDGGALRMRVYKVGTVHLEVHPDMAWKLNAILHTIYPAAIPAKFRTRQPRRKNVKLIDAVLHGGVISALKNMSWDMIKRTWSMGYSSLADKALRNEVENVLKAIGGVPVDQRETVFAFDYDARFMVDEIMIRGTIPHRVSYQYYPTPDELAAKVVALAGIKPGDRCLEPSAGQGHIAKHMPADSQLVEVSKVHADILSLKGFSKVHHGDFLQWATEQVGLNNRYDVICMNPPFDQGRWASHVEHAGSLLAAGGRLVAVLPSGAMGKEVIAGKKHVYHGPFAGLFDHTGVSVTVVVIS